MKKLLTLLLTAALVLSGCTTQPAGSTPESTPAPESSAASEHATPQMTYSQRERYTFALEELQGANNAAFTTNWSGTPISSDNAFSTGLSIIDAAPAEGGLVAVTAEIYGNLYLDPQTLQETIYGTAIPILTEGLPYSPQLALGKSVIELRDNAGGKVEILSCSYKPYASPGITYLKESAAKNPPPADSPKLDTSKYDPAFVNFIWHKLLQGRFIERPADITHADLAGMTGYLDLDWTALPQDADSETYLTDASLLRLMPNLTSVSCWIPLKDYSVFEGMNKLTELRLSNMNDARMATLRVGHTDRLHLEDPACDVLDLTNVNAETLSMISYSTAVGGFAGCERIKNLYINSTRTDMKLVNATAFPNAEYLNLQFYSDFERVRDFSQLATFADKAVIDLCLTHMACNDKTVATLAGVPLRLLVLSPQDNQYPDDALLLPIKAGQVLKSENAGEFSLRTKDTY